MMKYFQCKYKTHKDINVSNSLLNTICIVHFCGINQIKISLMILYCVDTRQLTQTGQRAITNKSTLKKFRKQTAF